MIYRDVDDLNARFWATPLTYKDAANATVALPETQKLVENQPDAEVDERKPWVRWTILPGSSVLNTTGAVTFKQDGMAVLQVFTPRGTGTGMANDIAECAETAFRKWRSADRALTVDRVERSRGADKDYHQVNIKVHYTSVRPG
jgi:hypothetical protein